MTKIKVHSKNECAISDILTVLRSTSMYVPEKKLFINAIDKLYNLGYYERECNNGEKVSLFRGLK